MTKDSFSATFFNDLRQSLPHGAMTKIAEKLTTPERKVSVRDVYAALHGRGLSINKCDQNVIIKEAIEIAKAANASLEEVKKLQEQLEATDK